MQTDPNNTTWARNTDSFGQKILRAQGWAPGEFLGAKDAAHARHHTEASSSHIRVVVKEDNLGLGAKRNNGDQCTGLDAFQDLLGRLNGKTEATIEVEREARMAVKRNLYVERKFGVMKFVQGGWLVGDQETAAIDALVEGNKSARSDVEELISDTSKSDTEMTEATAHESRKRKAGGTCVSKDTKKKKPKERKSGDEAGYGSEKERRRREKKERKSKKRKDKDSEANDNGEADDNGEAVNKKREKHRASKSSDDDQDTNSSDDVDRTEAASDATSKKSKKEKRKRKENRESRSNDDTDTEQKRSKKKRRKEQDTSVTASADDSASRVESKVASIISTPTPTGSGTSTPIRHLSRQRFIAHKKMAFADPKALAQVNPLPSLQSSSRIHSCHD